MSWKEEESVTLDVNGVVLHRWWWWWMKQGGHDWEELV
jgi:hypothetical protein